MRSYIKNYVLGMRDENNNNNKIIHWIYNSSRFAASIECIFPLNMFFIT